MDTFLPFYCNSGIQPEVYSLTNNPIVIHF